MTDKIQIDSLERGFRLGRWQVRPLAGELRAGHKIQFLRPPGKGLSRHVEPKAMRVLLALASQPGEFVSKESLIHLVWDGRPVTDDVLTHAIHALRAALDDNPRDPAYIETRNNVGYRLIAPVQRLPARRKAAALTGLAVASLLLTAVVLFWTLFSGRPEGGGRLPATIAVLPFMNLSVAEGSKYLAAGMTESLILSLSQQPGIRVISRTSVMPYADYQGSAKSIAENLGADYLVEGSVQQVDGQIRVVAQLIEPHQDEHIWARHYDRPLDDVLALQQNISESVALHIGGAVDTPLVTVESKIPPAATHDYLQARYDLSLNDLSAAQSALTTFRAITQAYPDFAEAYLGEAQARLFLFKKHSNDHLILEQGLQAALKYESLSGASSESHRCIAQIQLFLHWDFALAEQRYQAGITLNPSDTVARRRYAWLLVARQQYDQAVEQIQQVRLLDPSYYDNAELATLLLLSRKTTEAVREFERLDGIVNLGKSGLRSMATAYLATGRDREAHLAFVRMLDSAGRLSGDQADDLKLVSSQVLYQTILQLKPFKSDVAQAGFLSLLGDKFKALETLERAVANRDPYAVYLGALPELAGLHGYPGFQVLLDEIGVEAENISHLQQTRLFSENLINPQTNLHEN